MWADRLFFVTKPELTQPTISISGLKDEYQPYELITLDVKCQEENVNTPLLNREGPGVSLGGESYTATSALMCGHGS